MDELTPENERRAWLGIIFLMVIICLLLVFSAQGQNNELFRGLMYVKTEDKCDLQAFRIGAYEDNLVVMLDHKILQFENCLRNEESKEWDSNYLCKDKCGTNYNIRIVANKDGFMIVINNLLKKEEYYMISTRDICQ
jgi:hypothetical protein